MMSNTRVTCFWIEHIAIAFLLLLAPGAASADGEQREIDALPPKQAIGPGGVWHFESPANCIIKPSKTLKQPQITGRHAEYIGADTWYPSWISDGNMYLRWNDGNVNSLGSNFNEADSINYLALLAVLDDMKAPRPAAAKPGLWAVYYAWYETASGPHRKWSHWSDDKTAAQEPKPKSKAQPLIGYYDSDDPAVVRWHIQLAKAAGIDAFLSSWWGSTSLSGAAFEKVILPIAAEEHFKVALCSELAQFHHDVKTLARQMADVLRRTKDNPAYLRVDGKPLVYLYQVPFDPKLTPETFTELCRGIEAEVGPVYWMMDKVTNVDNRGLDFPEPWLKIPDIAMLGFYGTFSIKRIWKYEDLAPDYARLVQQAHAAGKKAFLPAHPGHDNSGFRPDDYFVIPRENGATLRGYLRAASDAHADAILLTSFNEWPETTVVEPTSSWKDPYLYLKILAEWKGIEFKPPPLPARLKGSP